MTKDKVLSVRFSPSEYELIEQAAKDKKIPPSSLVRSVVLTAIEQNFIIQSPSPALDKLSFDTRYQVLRPVDFLAGSLMLSGLSVPQVEQFLLHDARLAPTQENIEFHADGYQELELDATTS